MMERTHSDVSVAVSRRRRVGLGALAFTRSDALVALVLALALVLGGSARFMANNWDDFVRFHPDERHLSQV
ncbi:MAG: hypothetical protein ACOCZH_06405, partial [Phototrophicaceae bacterium]